MNHDDEVCCVLDQHADLNFDSGGSLKQQSADSLLNVSIYRIGCVIVSLLASSKVDRGF
jgi:hypothetical protein